MARNFLFRKILHNFDYTSIELEKKAAVLLTATFAAFPFMLIFPFFLLPSYELIYLANPLFFAILVALPYLVLIFIIIALALGYYHWAVSTFVWGLFLLVAFFAFVRSSGVAEDVYWVLKSTVLIILVASLVSIEAHRLFGLAAVATALIFYLFYKMPIAHFSQVNLIFLFECLAYLWFFTCVCAYSFHLDRSTRTQVIRGFNTSRLKLSKWIYVARETQRDIKTFEADLQEYIELANNLASDEKRCVEILESLKLEGEQKEQLNKALEIMNENRVKFFIYLDNIVKENEKYQANFYKNFESLEES